MYFLHNSGNTYFYCAGHKDTKYKTGNEPDSYMACYNVHNRKAMQMFVHTLLCQPGKIFEDIIHVAQFLREGRT